MEDVLKTKIIKASWKKFRDFRLTMLQQTLLLEIRLFFPWENHPF